MTSPLPYTQWTTAAQLASATSLPSWAANDADKYRIFAYELYDKIFWNVPETFRIVQRGTESSPVYLPSARTIINAICRYLCKDFDFVMVGEDENLEAYLTQLFRRERIYAKFASQKRSCVTKGDAVWHIMADQARPEGRRISILEVDPAEYFPITNPRDKNKVDGCYLITHMLNDEDSPIIKRQHYWRMLKPDGTYQIWSQVGYFETDGWDDRDGGELKPTAPPAILHKDPVEQARLQEIQDLAMTGFALPDLITALPVYHIMNDREPNGEFGSSSVRGMERVIAAVNQAMSDEEFALAMEGLGVYWTDSGPPTDAAGRETNWIIGPGRVAEVDTGTQFARVSGPPVAPSLEHIEALQKSMREATGVPDIAIGTVDVAVAESGIALEIKLGPILSGNKDKEHEILAVWDNMLHDMVTGWIPAYEGITSTATAMPKVEDPKPQNRDAMVQELVLLYKEGLLPGSYVAKRLVSLGYEDLTPEMVAEAEAALTARTAATDPFAQRVGEELAPGEGGGAGGAGTAPVGEPV